jgi:hypothetical protein
MTREQIAGFMLGMSIGVAIGYLLRPPDAAVTRTRAGGHQAMQREEKTA